MDEGRKRVLLIAAVSVQSVVRFLPQAPVQEERE